ncbi:dynein regulatory complex subunit 7 isoform X3 [Amblyraja radiata]|uniref:dynein regulatory complex subunit 7 isoform X3 n=1 Tax=Amblyraja radiata TaxID=386614 RepID=UPI001402D140|nr:dynein regulatory complex subunit 7 isoform X3 [Amblyraja radiata]
MDVLEESDEEGEPRTTGGKKKRTMSYVAKIDQLESLISDIGVMHYPEPYQQNTAKERTMLQYAENFRQQYEYLYPDRKPLLLSPLNECKMQKFVSTTLRPTLLNHKELYTWKGCATFVSDFLIVDSLDLITEVPSYLFASTTILKCQKGNSFDFSTLLCSILLGVGYDAYCVSGYATKEICLMDETKEICPLLQEDDKNKKKEIMPPVKKYTVKPVRELQSKFEINQEARRRAEKILDDEQKQKDYEEMINNVRFDLGDPVKWEYMLPSENQEIVVPDSYEYLDEGEDDDEKDVEKIFDMPPSWAQQIVIPAKDIETRCPKGEKIIQYKKANLEKYAPYLNIDGMVKRLIEYEDIECTSFLKVTEWYANRRDNLEKIERNMKTRTITEYFRNGRHLALRKHVFRSSEPETDRTMKFNGKLRVDGLMSRVETPTEMIGKFRDRPDFLIYRHTVFAKRLKKVKLPGASHSNYRTILKIIERFARNRKKPAHQDVAEQIFLITSEHVQLTYHREDDRITAVKREFILPPNLMQKDDQEVNMDQIVMTFEVDPLVKPCKNVVLYQTMIGLLKAQTTSMQAVRDSEHEVREILKDRAAERRANELTISVYDTERNEKAKEHRRTQMRIEEEQRLRRAEEEVDYLAPFLARLGQPKKITKKVAMTLRSDCLADMKQRLIDKANLIQSRFEKEALELQNKQQWYQQNQISMTKEDEQAYLSYCSEAMFRIHILELRLNKHKERAPTRYLALEDKIRKDSRLAKKLKDC